MDDRIEVHTVHPLPFYQKIVEEGIRVYRNIKSRSREADSKCAVFCRRHRTIVGKHSIEISLYE